MREIGDQLFDLLGEDAIRECLSKPFKLFHCEHCMTDLREHIQHAYEEVGPILIAVTCTACGKSTDV